jgi:hypothetical protein
MELHPALIHQGHSILAWKFFCARDHHPVVHISNNAVSMRGNEPAGELDGVVQFEAPDLGDKDLDDCLFVQFLVCHPFPHEGRDDTGSVDSPSALGVIPVEVARSGGGPAGGAILGCGGEPLTRRSRASD